jgi:hypothetical protein
MNILSWEAFFKCTTAGGTKALKHCEYFLHGPGHIELNSQNYHHKGTYARHYTGNSYQLWLGKRIGAIRHARLHEINSNQIEAIEGIPVQSLRCMIRKSHSWHGMLGWSSHHEEKWDNDLNNFGHAHTFHNYWIMVSISQTCKPEDYLQSSRILSLSCHD